MKFRYLGLFALAPVLSQCQPACTPQPDVAGQVPPPVEVAVPAREVPAAPVHVPVVPEVTTTTAAPFVPQFHLDIQPAGGSDVCSGEVFFNDGTGSLLLEIIDFGGNVVETHPLDPGGSATVPWYLLPAEAGGGEALFFSATVVTPGNPIYTPGYLLYDGRILKSQDCPAPEPTFEDDLVFGFYGEAFGDRVCINNSVIGWNVGAQGDLYTSAGVRAAILDADTGKLVTSLPHHEVSLPMTSDWWESGGAVPDGARAFRTRISATLSGSGVEPVTITVYSDEWGFGGPC